MLLQIVFVFMLSQNIFSNTLPFYNSIHHASLTRKATNAQLGVDVKTSDVAEGVHVEAKNLIQTQVNIDKIYNKNIKILKMKLRVI